MRLKGNLTRMRRLYKWNWQTTFAFALPFVLYLFTLAPTIYNLDSAELTTAAATGGITRATGYPLYLMLGFLWSRLPLGDVGYRLNLFSAFCGAITVMLLERILRRWQPGRWVVFTALGLLATAPHFWALSLIAEVYTLHTALMAALILALLRWVENATPRRAAWLGLILGLSLAHHAATVLLLPGAAWYLIAASPRRSLTLRACLFGLAGLLVGLSVYLYLPLRYAAQPAFNYAGSYDSTGLFHPIDLQSFNGFWWLISGRAFTRNMLAYDLPGLGQQIVVFARQLARAFLTVGIGPGLVGCVVLLRRNGRMGIMLVLMFVVHAAFYVSYRAGDKETMFLPDYLIWAIWVGIGCEWLLAWLGDQPWSSRQWWGVLLIKGILACGVILAAIWNWTLVDLSGDWSARERGEAIMREVAPNALIVGYWDTVPIIQYLQWVEGQRPDVEAINRFLISPAELHNLILREISRRPVYIDLLPDDLSKVLETEPLGEIDRLFPQENP